MEESNTQTVAPAAAAEFVPPRLWSKNFLIITIGSLISMLGNSVAGFAMGLLVLDQTDSVLLFALTNIVSTLPGVIMPLVAGTFFDRHSRRKAIYILDFVYTTLFLLIATSLFFNFFNIYIYLVTALIIGCVGGCYNVAFDSLFPLMTTKKTATRAFAINSLLFPLAAAITYPLTVLGYENLAPENSLRALALLFFASSALFLVTAAIETQMRFREPHLMRFEPEKQLRLPPSPKELELAFEGKGAEITAARPRRNFFADFKEGVKYLWSEKGLLAITAYFFTISISAGFEGTVRMPYMKNTIEGGLMVFAFVSISSLIGRLVGALIQYKTKVNPQKRFKLAVWVYIVSAAMDAVLLFLPVWGMFPLMFAMGIITVTSYNIRIAATQTYIPDEKRGRYNGVFVFVNVLGTMLGQVLGGFIGDTFFAQIPWAVAAVYSFNIVMVFVIVLPNRRHMIPIYNQKI